MDRERRSLEQLSKVVQEVGRCGVAVIGNDALAMHGDTEAAMHVLAYLVDQLPATLAWYSYNPGQELDGLFLYNGRDDVWEGGQRLRARVLCIQAWSASASVGFMCCVLCAAFPGIVHRVISARKAVGYAECR